MNAVINMLMKKLGDKEYEIINWKRKFFYFIYETITNHNK